MKTITPITEPQRKRLVALAKGHQKSDEYIRGTYWDKDEKKGCAVGCTIADAKREGILNGVDYGDHEALATALGCTRYMTLMIDHIFEGLGQDDAVKWTPKFLASLKVNIDYSSMETRMAIALLTDKEIGLAEIATREDVRAVAKLTADLYKRRLAGDEPTDAEWDAARQQAYAARQQFWLRVRDLFIEAMGKCPVTKGAK